MNELRLHLACESKRTNPPDIEQALNQWGEINKDPRKWAKFEAFLFTYGRIVRVIWGIIHSNGIKEPIQSISYCLSSDGNVYTTKQTFP